jgi:hypothetical protein
MDIGEWGSEPTTAKARQRAQRLRSELGDHRDPLLRRRKRSAAERFEETERKQAAEAFTLNEPLKTWDNRYLKKKRPMCRLDALSRIRTSLAGLLERPAADINRAELARALPAAADACGRVGADRCWRVPAPATARL